MTPSLIFSIFLAYTALLFFITWLTARKAIKPGIFHREQGVPWFVVAYGMIGASLSGVTFMSVPGLGRDDPVFLYDGGARLPVRVFRDRHRADAAVLPAEPDLHLLPTLNTVSDSGHTRPGPFTFILSRVIGASFRMFLVVNVLQVFVFDAWGIPFSVTTLIFIILILLYTFKGGIKTIIWTDTVQTTFMLLALVISIY